MSNRPLPYPDAASLAARRAWYAGVGSRDAIERYRPDQFGEGKSALSVLGRIRRQLADFAVTRHRDDLTKLFQRAAGERTRHSKAVVRALDNLPSIPVPHPQVSDPIDPWLPSRAVVALREHGIRTLADLTVRIPRRRRGWLAVPGLRVRSACGIEAFFATHSSLTERVRALVPVVSQEPVVPWERINLPHEVDGSRGTFRGPRRMWTLDASNDYQAIGAWLARHEAAETQRAYRREAGRLLLWGILERGRRCPR